MSLVSKVEGALNALTLTNVRTVDVVHSHRLGRTRLLNLIGISAYTAWYNPVIGKSYTVKLGIAGEYFLWMLRKYELPMTDDFTDAPETQRFLEDYKATLECIKSRGFTPNPRAHFDKWNIHCASYPFYEKHKEFRESLWPTQKEVVLD
jgi:hypothetical protein